MSEEIGALGEVPDDVDREMFDVRNTVETREGGLKLDLLQRYVQTTMPAEDVGSEEPPENAELTTVATEKFEHWVAVRDTIEGALGVEIERAWMAYNLNLGASVNRSGFVNFPEEGFAEPSQYRKDKKFEENTIPIQHEDEDVNFAMLVRVLVMWGFTDDTGWSDGDDDEQNLDLRVERAEQAFEDLNHETTFIDSENLQGPGKLYFDEEKPTRWEYVLYYPKLQISPNLYLTDNDSDEAKARNRGVLITEHYEFVPYISTSNEPLDEVPDSKLDQYVDALDAYIDELKSVDIDGLEYPQEDYIQVARRRREIIRFFRDDSANMEYYRAHDVFQLWALENYFYHQLAESPDSVSGVGDRLESFIAEEEGPNYNVWMVVTDLLDESDEFDSVDDLEGATINEIIDEAADVLVTDGRDQLDRFLRDPTIEDDDDGSRVDVAVRRFEDQVYAGGTKAMEELDVGWRPDTGHYALATIQDEITERIKEREYGAERDGLEEPVDDGESIYAAFGYDLESEVGYVPGPFHREAPDVSF